MKRLLFICLLLFSGTTFASPPPGPQLSFRYANPRIIRLSGFDNLQFDVQLQCNQTGYYLWAVTVKLNFNNTTFNNTATNWGVSQIGAFSGTNSQSGLKYTVTKTVTGTSPGKVCNIALTGDVNAAPNGPNATDFAEAPTSWTTMITVSARLLDTSGDGLAGISFLQAGMNGFEQYIPDATGVFSTFPTSNLYDTHDFLTAYTGRFYSSGTNLWSQIGGPTNNSQFVNWATPVSTTVWDGTATMPSGVANLKALRVESPATLTIPVDGQVTVTGTPGTTVIDTPNGLTIQSSASGTGSLITNSITGSGIAQNYLTTGRWHLVSSPVVQDIASFLTANSNVPTSASNRGMMDYDAAGNAWNPFFTTGTGSAGAGKGYCLRSAANGIVTFTGAVQAGTISPTGLTANKWNCVGNPFTSAIGINSGATSTTNFLSVNSGNLDATYGAVYLWDNADNGGGAYTAVSNVLNPSISAIAQGQAFMVKMNSATQLDFIESSQLHQPSLALKSATTKIWPLIKLTATVNNVQNSTIIAYNSGMTKGLDPTYDAGLFKGAADLVIYSKLVEDVGTPFAIQALPDNNYNSMIIPIGVDSKTGGQVVFSAETFNLPSGVKVILEDIQAKTFTDLSTSSYKAIIAANSDVSDRFRLHNSTATTQGAIGDPALAGKLNAYAYLNSEIRVVGDVSKDAVATLYDVQGKSVLIQKLSEGSLNVIPISGVSTGLYLLSVKDGAKSQTFKILLKD